MAEVHRVGSVRVLVVDDEEIFRRAITAVVAETDGFVVVGTAASGEDSLAVAVAIQPDLVLMDINLPGIDGIEATRRLRSNNQRPVVLLLSTYDEGDVDYAGAGAASYISKAAFGPDRLAAAWAAANHEAAADDDKEMS
jgi:CheY-like chemotaxis protein